MKKKILVIFETKRASHPFFPYTSTLILHAVQQKQLVEMDVAIKGENRDKYTKFTVYH